MTLSRRQFLGASVTLPALVALSPGLNLNASKIAWLSAPASNPVDRPPVEVIALNRMAFGPRPGDVERVRALGLAAYVEEQLNPDDSDDPLYQQKLQAATLHIEYEAEHGYPDTNEDRLLTALDKPLSELWALSGYVEEVPYYEWIRPLTELHAATWLRAVYSQWQLREVLVDFWHNHFNVNAYNDDSRIAATWPIYDREVIRKNCLGNFRVFLEDVAKSQAMLFYLNNASSKASPANENYARELFELHTLGADNYLNNQYEHWRDVPGALEGRPSGYIDDDVYEAARAFTGWTIADGAWIEEDDTLPNTGEFYYHAAWHDPYQKRILGVEFDSHQPPLADGRRVLDLVAAHPATARFVCTKLCRRLVADNPPDSLIQQAVAVWTAAQDQPDQIKQTVRAILLSPEFAQSWGQKVKRPFELAASFLRATAADFTPTEDLFWTMGELGQSLFSWPAPNGFPDRAGYWVSTNIMLGRWNIPLYLISDWFGVATFDLWEQQPAEVTTSRHIVAFWLERLLGRPVSDEIYRDLLDFMRQDADPDAAPQGEAEELTHRLNNLVALISMTPDFQWR